MAICGIIGCDSVRNNGKSAAWDIAAGQQNPDLTIVIWRRDSPSLEWEVGLKGDAFRGTKMNHSTSVTARFSYSQSGNAAFSYPKRQYRLSLYHDGDPGFSSTSEEQLMGGITFTPYQEGEEFPKLIKLSGTKVDFEIAVEYVE